MKKKRLIKSLKLRYYYCISCLEVIPVRCNNIFNLIVNEATPLSLVTLL